MFRMNVRNSFDPHNDVTVFKILGRFIYLFIYLFAISNVENRGSLSVDSRTRDRKVASSNPGKSGGRIFFSRVNFVC